MQRLLIATRNRHKTAEFAQILDGLAVVEDLHSHPGLPEIEETGTTFLENAILKAEAASLHLSHLGVSGAETWVLADDSGLAVDALGGAPGVYSARYAGEQASDAENLRLLLQRMEGQTASTARTARFHCAIAIAQGGALRATFEGTCEGTLATAPTGGGGFGYDPAFIPVGETRSFAEISAAEKNAISHRAAAMREALAWLRQALG